MAPTKSTTTNQAATATMSTLMPLARKGLTRQNKHHHHQQQQVLNIQDQNIICTMQTRGKRKAENSPMKNEKIKRSALGNLTNNVKVMSLTSILHPEDGAKSLKVGKKTTTTNYKDNNLFGGTQQQHQQLLLQQLQILKDTQNIGSAGHHHAIAAPAAANAGARQAPHKITTRAASKNATVHTTNLIDEETCKLITNAAVAAYTAKAKDTQQQPQQQKAPPPAPVVPHLAAPVAKVQQKPVRRISNEFNKTEESLYMSALDFSSSESMRLSGNFEAARRRSQILQQNQKTDEKHEVQTDSTDEEQLVAVAEADDETEDLPEQQHEKKCEKAEVVPVVPAGVDDFDKANWNDPFQVSYYAMDIFNYLKSREKEFVIDDYMEKQVHLSKWMRSLLVDWMVEVQETFELNHETLYLAVKIVDLYLCRVVIFKDKLQLLGAAALFIACKFDERTPPLIEDFLYICDGAYKQDELIKMEVHTLRTINFDLGIPLSYRFLRRYARCAKVPMPTLTLARYILELSLMDYATISASDSQLAAAALFMALRLHGEEQAWTPTLEYYSGYKLAEFAEWVPVLNAGLHRKPKGTIKTIRSKYSHKIFHEVAKVTLMTTEQLFEHNLDLNVSIQPATGEEQQHQKQPTVSNST